MTESFPKVGLGVCSLMKLAGKNPEGKGEEVRWVVTKVTGELNRCALWGKTRQAQVAVGQLAPHHSAHVLYICILLRITPSL